MKSALVRLFAVGALIGLGACASGTEPSAWKPEVPKFTCVANSATMRLPEAFRANLPAFGDRGPQDEYVEISQTVPGGFGGLFLHQGKLVLTFVDTATANANRQQISAVFAGRGYNYASDVATAEFRDARWTFAELDEWFRYIIPKLSVPGVSSMGIDERANTINFGVIDEDARARLEGALASLGASCNLMTTVIEGYATPH